MAHSPRARLRRAIARFQRICCHGLGGKAFMPGLFSALQDIIPASNRQFYFASPQLEIADCYLEGPSVALLPVYLSEFYNRRERDVRRTFAAIMRTKYTTAAGDIFPRYASVDWRTFLRSDFYNLAARPCGMLQGINLKVTEGNRPIGALNLFRTGHEPAFTSRDIALLGVLQGFIAHALRDGSDEGSYINTEDRALVIVDPDGKLLHLSAEAHRLLSMALVDRWSPETAWQLRLEQPPELLHLCKNLVAAYSGALPSGPPVLRRRNAWGEFILRAYWLDASSYEVPERYIGITLDRYEPRSLALLRKVEALPLTDREKELCLLLARGQSAANAARAMGVAESTVITHRRHLYDKLGVGSRSALTDRLQ